MSFPASHDNSASCPFDFRLPIMPRTNATSETPARPASVLQFNCLHTFARTTRSVTSATRRLDFLFAQKGSRLLGQHGIDIKSASPFEAGDSCQPRNDLQMPVVMGQLFGIKGRRVNDVVIRRIVERQFEFAQ